MHLIENFKKTEKIEIYKNGEISGFYYGEENFEKILIAWYDLVDGARRCPAFGVSLNTETERAVLSGVWVEFYFNEVLECNGMPYERLLVEVNKEYCGFNVIRYNSEVGYEGRCFYIQLIGKDMRNFYHIIMNI